MRWKKFLVGNGWTNRRNPGVESPNREWDALNFRNNIFGVRFFREGYVQ